MSQSERKHSLFEDGEVPLASVALITSNRANFIEDCLQSILGQMFQNFEIVVADDYPATELPAHPSKFINNYRAYIIGSWCRSYVPAMNSDPNR